MADNSSIDGSIFQIAGYVPEKASLVQIDSDGVPTSSVIFGINPESIEESAQTDINNISTINSNLPRLIVTGLSVREVRFTALIHGMTTEPKEPNLSSAKSKFSDVLGRVRGNVTDAAISIVPFASNVVRGITSASDLTDINPFGLFNDDRFDLNSDGKNSFNRTSVDSQIKQLLSMQTPKDGYTAIRKVRLNGYPAYNTLDFYISSINISRQLWSTDLSTQFAEVNITLMQVGANNVVGKLDGDQ